MWPFTKTKLGKMEEELDLSMSRLKRKVEQERAELSSLKEFIELEKEDQAVWGGIKAFVPNVKIKKFKAGEFLLYEEHEIFLNGIKGISLHSFGSIASIGRIKGDGDFWSHNHFLGTYYVDTCHKGEDAKISIEMKSGMFHEISCHPYETDILFHHLTKAWEDWKEKNS